ncbi:OVARIAN TUMOR DOMAIN-containing deubiquitinating enzyme 7 isoform X2 [Impatiens glandulifera]|nr:OVARIAN TUMOR DOMAIN-containing deubiquitinating enzyme 7 isoform X2 [Impatiens glandulifera]
MVVQFIMKNREMFEPFIEDDMSFDEYCKSMETDGTWAGHMELQAGSLVTHSNICIHRHLSPRWYIKNFNDSEARMIHLSYHDGEHYNSVRLREDTCLGPARDIIIKADTILPATSGEAKTAAVKKSRRLNGTNFVNTDSITMVMTGSGCEDVKRAEQILLQVSGDVDAAIEFLIASQGLEDTNNFEDLHQVKSETRINEADNKGISDQSREPDLSFDMEGARDDISLSSLKAEKHASRNKVCPCGSKKKNKACCGSSAKTSSKLSMSQSFDNNRKDRKIGRKKGAKIIAKSQQESEGRPLDMGALCI